MSAASTNLFKALILLTVSFCQFTSFQRQNIGSADGLFNVMTRTPVGSSYLNTHHCLKMENENARLPKDFFRMPSRDRNRSWQKTKTPIKVSSVSKLKELINQGYKVKVVSDRFLLQHPSYHFYSDTGS
jgi:hypothetical protein